MKAKTYYGLRTMAKKFKKCGQVENIVAHLQNMPIYYVKYKKEEDKVKVLIGLIHEEGVVRVVATEEKNVNMSVTMEHCFKNKRKQETTKKQQLLKISFEIKRYGKRLLVKIKEEEMYKILIDRAFTEDEDRKLCKN